MSGTVIPYERASPTLLALQPATTQPKRTRADPSWAELFNHVEGRIASLRVVRLSWWRHWALLAEYILPARYRWLIVANDMNRGNNFNRQITDNTGTMAMRVCAAGMMSGLMSPSRPWFKFSLHLPSGTDPDQDAKAWLQDTEQRVYAVLAEGNFYNSFAQAFQDLVVFGTAPVIIYEDEENIVRCYGPCAGEYYLAEGSSFEVDTLYREFTMTIAQIVDMFGLVNCPNEIQTMWETKGGAIDNERTVCHAIEPNFALRGGSIRPSVQPLKGDWTYREVYWIRGTMDLQPLSLRGFIGKPFVAPRWDVTGNDPYGRSPGMDALGDIMQLQSETRRKGELLEKIVRPPMGADVGLKNEPSSILPGHVTYMATDGNKKGFWPLMEMPAGALAPLTEDVKEVQGRIERAFYKDVFLMISQMEGVQPRNEMEIAERKGEKIQVLGPVIERFESECASPAIKRVLDIMIRRKMIAPKPASLRNVNVQIEYVSMMKLAQRASETAAMERTFQIAGNLSAAAKASGAPDPLDILDLDESLRAYGDDMGFPAAAMRAPDKVAELRAQRAQAMQHQQMMAAAQPAVDAAQTLSQTKLGGGQSALDAILGTGSGQ